MKIMFAAIFFVSVIIARKNVVGVGITIGNKNIGIGSGGVSTTKNDPVTFGNPNCAKCTENIQNTLSLFITAFQTMELEYDAENGTAKCGNCTFTGVETLDLYGDACASLAPTDSTLVLTNLNLIFHEVQLQCTCQDVLQVASIPMQILGSLGSCGGDDTNLDPSATTGGLTQTIQTLNPLEVASCILASKATVPALNVTITMTWNNVTIHLEIQKNTTIKGSKGTTIKQANVIERNYANIHTSCDSDATGVDLCKCVSDTNILAPVIEQVVEAYAQCAVSTTDSKFQFYVDSYLTCGV